MRYLVGCALVLVTLMALPQSAAAQTGEQAPAKAGPSIHAHHHLPPQLMLGASYYLYLDADAEDTTSDPASESSLEESVSAPAPGTEAPDIDTLSQRAIEHYDIHYKTQSEERKKRRRRRTIALSVTIPIVVVGAGLLIVGAVAVSNMEF